MVNITIERRADAELALESSMRCAPWPSQRPNTDDFLTDIGAAEWIIQVSGGRRGNRRTVGHQIG